MTANTKKISKRLQIALFIVVFMIIGSILIVRSFAASDTTPPSTPQNLRVTATSDTTISLAWDPSTDNASVTEYIVYRNGYALPNTVPQSATPTFTDVNLWPNSTNSYYVQAKDPTGNLSAASPVTTTFTKPDTTPPSAPTNLTGKFSISDKSVSLNWNGSTDNVKMNYYDVWRSASGVLTKIASTKITSYVDLNPPLNTNVQYFVIAYDAFFNASVQSNNVYVKTDTQPPSAPVGLRLNGVTNTSVSVSWSLSTDNIGVASYNVYRNGVKIGSRTYLQTLTYLDGNPALSAGTSYIYYITAVDTSGLESSPSASLVATTSGGTTTAPNPPTNLTAVQQGTSTYLSWSASTTSGISSYVIYRGGSAIGSSSSTSFTDSSAPQNQTLSYYVVAKTTVESAPSNVVSVYLDTLPPLINFTNPLDGTTVSGSVNVAADISDNTTLSQVDFYVDGYLAQAGSNKSYSWDSSKYPNGSHTLMIKAYDSNGNVGSATQQVVSKNGDQQPPTNPTNLVTTNLSYNKISLAWSPSSDNTAVAGYYVIRNNVTIGQTLNSNFEDNSVADSSSYDYYVLAYDAVGNVSQPSNVLKLTSPQAPPSDTAPPSKTTISSATVVGSSQINLAWTASSDNIGVDHYDIYRLNSSDILGIYSKIASVNGTTFGDAGLSAASKYTYYVVAVDAAGNLSAASTTKSARTGTISLKSYISGVVTGSAGLPLSGATVSLYVSGGTKSYRTSSSGNYLIGYGLNGTYRLKFSMQNYITANEEVNILGGQSITVNKALDSQ